MAAQTRRRFLGQVGTAVAIPATSSSVYEEVNASYPEYPTIPDAILDEYGWQKRDGEYGEWQNEKNDALWSIRTYEWTRLRESIREKTGGVVDIPLGGLIAMRIGNNGETRRVLGKEITEGESFTSPKYARFELSDAIRRTYLTFLDRFSMVGFNPEGEMNWNLSPAFPASLGFYTDECHDGGTLNTETNGSIKLTQHYLEYPLRETTVNEDTEVSLASEEYLEFHGWLGSWIHEDSIYAVVGVHPNDQSTICGISDPHLENVLDEVLEEEIELGLEESLYGRLHSVMSTVE
jgi:hypothetical protein